MITLYAPDVNNSKSIGENITALKDFCMELVEQANHENEQLTDRITELENMVKDLQEGE